MRTVAALTAVALAAASLGGCLLAEAPLGEPWEGRLDPALFGTWHVDDRPRSTVEIQPLDEHQYAIRTTDYGTPRQPKITVDLYRAFETRLGGVSFLNITWVGDGIHTAKDRRYYVGAYAVHGRTLTLRLLPAPGKAIDDPVGKSTASLRAYALTRIRNGRLVSKEIMRWRRG